MNKTIKRSEVSKYIKALNDIVGDSGKMTEKIQIKVQELGFEFCDNTRWYTRSKLIKEMTIDDINYLTIGFANNYKYRAYIIKIIE